MSDVITGLRQVIQDLVAPDLKALSAKVDSLQRQNEIQHDAVMKTMDAFRAEMRSEFAALRANNIRSKSFGRLRPSASASPS